LSKTLISFLGRAQQDKTTGYHTATYRFPDGTERTTPFFGRAMAEVIRPDRLVLLGTAGSMWDVLVEHLTVSGELEDLRLELIEASTAQAVTPDLLERVCPLIACVLGLPCILRLIPYGRTEAEQGQILEVIADAVPEGSVVIDLTHGFRHLAALGLLCAFFLERVAHLSVSGLYYGARDMRDDGVAPVLRLDGLLSVQRWIDALDRFDQSGDYGVFDSLLIADGVPRDKARCLTEAAFHERNFNLADARRKLQTFLPVLDHSLPGASRLFQRQLTERLAWARQGDLFAHQRHLAYLYLERCDYVRAAIFGYEALVIRECQRRGFSLQDFKSGREPAADALDAEVRAGLHPEPVREGYWLLKNLRNALAHGNPAQGKEVRATVANPDKLPRELRRAIDRVLS
jgi:CRISPR-associated Csx2 family protein